jgi:hypothetical protein
MKKTDITERATQQPFRPFAIETIGGSWIEVQDQSKIFLPPARPDLVIIFDPNGRLFILGIDQISAVESK